VNDIICFSGKAHTFSSEDKVYKIHHVGFFRGVSKHVIACAFRAKMSKTMNPAISNSGIVKITILDSHLVILFPIFSIKNHDCPNRRILIAP
jgi:hypothetical protein